MKTKNLDKIRKIKITCPNGKKQKDVLTLKPCTIPTAEVIRTVGAQRVRLEKRYGDAKTAMILDYIAFCVSKPSIQAIRCIGLRNGQVVTSNEHLFGK